MEPDAPWYYWNNLPANIPEDVTSLSSQEKDRLLIVWKQAIITENTQTDERRLDNIRELTKISLKVPKWLMDRTKEAAALYVEGYWLASIALSGSIGEYVSWYILQSAIREKGIGVLVGFRRILSWQAERIGLLFKRDLITEGQKKHLQLISETRNDYVHVEKTGPPDEVKAKALEALRNLIELLNDLYPVDESFRPP